MGFCAVIYGDIYVKFLCNTDRGQNIICPVRMYLQWDHLLKNRHPRFYIKIFPVQSAPLLVLPVLYSLRQCSAQKRCRSHSGRGTFSLVPINGFGIFPQRCLHSCRIKEGHIVHAPPLRLHKDKLSSHYIGTSRSGHDRSDPCFDGVMECRVHGIHSVNCPQSRCHRAGLLITVIPDSTPLLL